ncbi:MAG: flagellar protein FlgN, partial [Lachnospiraceae bacterium]|nr:flagellar protein FlgN [Lachnospiraceae bacterium]
MENLIQVLGQECMEYEGLLTLSRQKTQIIASANLEELQKITDDEQEVVDRLNRLE